MVITQPGGAIKLANVSQVRLRQGKKKFDIICYPNKVQDWRKGIEKDLDEVLQLPSIFVNVNKGQVASASELKESFGISDVNKVILEILQKGELQIGDKERAQAQQEAHAKVLLLVVSKTINPRNKHPYTVGMIEKSLSLLGFQYSTTKSAKGQANEAVRMLVERQIVPIKRAKMRIRITDDKTASSYAGDLDEILEQVESKSWDHGFELIAVIDPGEFRRIDEFVAQRSGGGGLVDVVDLDTES